MAYENDHPQHDLHVIDWIWATLEGKRPIFKTIGDEPIFTIERDRHDSSDLRTQPNWSLP